MRNFIRRLSGKRKLRIATFITGAHTLPSAEVVYAPMELTEHLVQGLEERGHEVTVYAPKGSTICCSRLVTDDLPALLDNKKTSKILSKEFTRDQERHLIRMGWDNFLLGALYRDVMKGQFDLVHSHTPDRTLPFAKIAPHIPTVYTLHDPIFPWRKDIFELFDAPYQQYIAISKAQQRTAPKLRYAGLVHNGVATDTIPVGTGKGGYLLCLGRMMPQKGIDVAIRIAQKTGDELLLVGTQPYPSHQEWWDTKVKPHLNNRIRYVGPAWGKDRFKYFGNAKALLFPIQWEEPFGLVMIESLASGTPVIGLNRASVPEIIEHGVTGFVEKTWQGMAKAVGKLDQLDRADCRRSAEKRFSTQHMVDEYEKIFLKLAK